MRSCHSRFRAGSIPGAMLAGAALAGLGTANRPVAAEGSVAAAPFTRVTTGELVETPAAYWGGAWGDYDDDGWLDLFVGADANSTQSFLYHNDRDGTFTRDADAMPKIDSNQHGVAWADYDNDGHLDLIVTAGNPGEKHNALYHNEGDGTLAGVTSGPIYTETRDGGFHAPSWGDYDGDGLVDLFIAGHDTLNRLFHNDGDGSFSRITNSVVVSEPAASEGRAWVDYDGDGDLDLFVSNAHSHPNALYQNDGTGAFARVSGTGLDERVEATSAVCWADYDNDGDLDLYLANADLNSLYRNDGDGGFSSIADSVTVTEGLPGAAISTNCAWADYDNDGFLDLYVSWGNPFITPSTSFVFLFHNEGDGTFARVTEGELVTRRGGFPAFGDYDNDGFVDLLLSSGAFSQNYTQLYHNDGNANAWLIVKLIGTVSNRSAIGAKVRVHASYRGASRWQLREISGGDGQENQQSLDAEFGLADATNIDTVRVEWPSGIVQDLTDVTPRQRLTVTEAPEPGQGLQLGASAATLMLLAHLQGRRTLSRSRRHRSAAPARSSAATGSWVA